MFPSVCPNMFVGFYPWEGNIHLAAIRAQITPFALVGLGQAGASGHSVRPSGSELLRVATLQLWASPDRRWGRPDGPYFFCKFWASIRPENDWETGQTDTSLQTGMWNKSQKMSRNVCKAWKVFELLLQTKRTFNLDSEPSIEQDVGQALICEYLRKPKTSETICGLPPAHRRPPCHRLPPPPTTVRRRRPPPAVARASPPVHRMPARPPGYEFIN